MKKRPRTRAALTLLFVSFASFPPPALGSGAGGARNEPAPDVGQFQAGPLNRGHYVGALSAAPHAREILFFGSRDGYFHALDLETRNELWRQEGGYRVSLLPNVTQVIGGSFVGSPLIVDGVVYAGATDGRLYAMEAASGKLLWVFAAASKSTDTGMNIVSQIHGTAVCSGETLFVGSTFHLFALERENGKVIWTKSLRMWNSSPAVSDGIVYAANVEGRLHAFSARTGELLWEGRGTATPTITNGAVYVGAKDGLLYAYDAKTGRKKWDAAMGGTIGSAAVSGGTVLSGAYYDWYDAETKRFRKHFVALGAEDGKTRWFVETSGNFRSSPTVCADRVYFADTHGVVYCALTEDGSVLWKTALGDGEPTSSSPTSSPIVWKERLYIGGSDNKLHCLDAGNGREVWAFETTGEVSGTPAVATAR